VGQQPNIELEISDLPRPRRKPGLPEGWTPGRPGELGGPEDMRWGAGFGTPGTDAGYAHSLAAQREIALAEDEHRANADLAIAAVAAARSSMFGRAPTKKDVDLALVLLGYDDAGVAAAASSALAKQRLEWFAAAGHHPEKLREFVSDLDPNLLKLTADEVRSRMAAGENLINR